MERTFQSIAALCVNENVTEETAVLLLRSAFAEPKGTLAPLSSNKVDSFIGAQVLSEWHQNPKFLTSSGDPAPLSISDGTFASLCNATAAQHDTQAIIDLLIRAGAAEVIGDTVVSKTRDLVIAGNDHPAAARRATWLCSEFLSTLTHNLTKAADSPGRFERTAVSVRLHERHIPSLLAYLGVHGQSFLEDVDSWMSARQSKERCATVGVGVYLFVAKNESGVDKSH